MHEATKFLFDTSFEGRTSERTKRPDGRPVPTRTEEELEAARHESYAAGHAAGIAETRAEVETVAAQALTVISRELGTLGGVQTAALETMRRECAALAHAIGRKLAPALIQRYPLVEIEALVHQCLAELHDEPRVVVRASETTIAALKSRVAEVSAHTGFPGQVVLLPDDAMQGANCRIEWADGGVERDAEALSRRLDAAIQRFLEGEKA
jgi:flagellar assembly protein FliH